MDEEEKKKTLLSQVSPAKYISRYARPVILFIVSFSLVGISVLGYHWYGKQLKTRLSKSVSVFSLPQQAKTAPMGSGNYFDPLDVVQVIKEGNAGISFLDIRSDDEYKKEHIKGAISAPIYHIGDGNVAYYAIDGVLGKIRLDKAKQIVVYGPSNSFQRQQEVMSQLKKRGYSAKLLAVGWNEFRHFQNIWIPEPLWGKIDVNSLIDSN